jgi:hypothetical protein
VADERFGPNTAEVEALFERLRRLTPDEWERVANAAPGVGAIPDLEVKQSPEYFKALEAATPDRQERDLPRLRVGLL